MSQLSMPELKVAKIFEYFRYIFASYRIYNIIEY